MGTEDRRRAIIAQVAVELRDLAETLRAVRAQEAAAGGNTDWLDQASTDLEPVLVLVHEAEVAGAVGEVLARHGPGPWPDDDLAALAGVAVTELRQLRDQLTAAGPAKPIDDPHRRGGHGSDLE